MWKTFLWISFSESVPFYRVWKSSSFPQIACGFDSLVKSGFFRVFHKKIAYYNEYCLIIYIYIFFLIIYQKRGFFYALYL